MAEVSERSIKLYNNNNNNNNNNNDDNNKKNPLKKQTDSHLRRYHLQLVRSEDLKFESYWKAEPYYYNDDCQFSLHA